MNITNIELYNKYNVVKRIYIKIEELIESNINLKKGEKMFAVNNYCINHIFNSYHKKNKEYNLKIGNFDLEIVIMAENKDRKKKLQEKIHILLMKAIFTLSSNNSNYIVNLNNIDLYSRNIYSRQIFDYFYDLVLLLNDMYNVIKNKKNVNTYFGYVIQIIGQNNISNTHNKNFMQIAKDINDTYNIDSNSLTQSDIEIISNYINVYQNVLNTLKEYHSQIYFILNSSDIIDVYQKKKCFTMISKMHIMNLINKFLPDNQIVQTVNIHNNLVRTFENNSIEKGSQFKIEHYENGIYNINVNSMPFKFVIYQHEHMSINRLLFDDISYYMYSYDYLVDNIDSLFIVLDGIYHIKNNTNAINTFLYLYFLKYNKNIEIMYTLLPIFDIYKNNYEYFMSLQNNNIISHDITLEYITDKLSEGSLHFTNILNTNASITNNKVFFKFCIAHRILRKDNTIIDIFGQINKFINFIAN